VLSTTLLRPRLPDARSLPSCKRPNPRPRTASPTSDQVRPQLFPARNCASPHIVSHHSADLGFTSESAVEQPAIEQVGGLRCRDHHFPSDRGEGSPPRSGRPTRTASRSVMLSCLSSAWIPLGLARFLGCRLSSGARRGQGRSSGWGLHLDRVCAPAGWRLRRNRGL
jgi:hypothetical protein